MAGIELVIKIPEEEYKEIASHTDEDYSFVYLNLDQLRRLDNAIRKGTPLPKGHGDLIDRKELKKEVHTTTEWNGDVHRIVYEASVDDARPIIEADKESD